MGLNDLKKICGFTLNETKFNQVKNSWGNGKWAVTGDAALTETLLRYRVRNDSISFSGSEISGDAFDAVVIESGADTSLPEASFNKELDIAGFRLGMTKKAFTSNLVKLEKHPENYKLTEKSEANNTLRFKFTCIRKIKERSQIVGDKKDVLEDFYDELSINASFLDGRLRELSVYTTLQD